MSKNIVRVNKNKNYTVMSNHHLNDKSLSWKAKGIHSYILSLPDDWKVIIEHLRTVSRDGRDSTRSGIQELYDLRYWQRYPVYENGLIKEWVTEIYEEPFPQKEKIKTIVVKNNIRTINYEDGSVDNSCVYNITLLTDIPLIVENTSVDLLTENQQIDNQEIDNPELLNTNNTNNLLFTNHSFIQEKENEGMSDIYNYYNSILENIEIDYVEDIYKIAIKECIKTLCFSKSIKTKNMIIPQKIILKDIKNLRYSHIEYSLNVYKKRASKQQIRNPIIYLATIIYNSLSDMNIKIDAELRKDGIIS